MAGQQLPIGGFETGGLVLDSNPFSLEPNQMSDCLNVRFDNKTVSKILGEQQFLDLGSNNPRTLTHWKQPVSEFYVFTGDDGRTRRIDAVGNITDITRGIGSGIALPLASTSDASYTASLFNGGFTYVVSDGVGVPQYIQASGAAAGELRELPNFNYGTDFTSVTPRVLRPFRNVLVAANMRYQTQFGQVIHAPGTIRVSDQAAPGAIPSNWDPFENVSDTGSEFEISETSGIVDLVPFQNSLFIYTADSIFAMTLTGNSSFPVAVQKQLDGRGLLSTNCAVEFYGRHFVVGNEDIYLYAGGATVQTVADGRVRDYFFDNINRNAIDSTFVFHNTRHDEMWLCYPRGANVACSEALIWNYVHNTWTRRELDNVYAATFGSDIEGDGFSQFQVPVFARDDRLLQTDIGTSFSGRAIESYFERTGFDIVPQATEFSKWIDDIYIIATGVGNVTVSVRSTDTPGRPVNFNNLSDRFLRIREFSLSGDMGDYRINPKVNGRYFNIRFGSNDALGSWEVVRYNLSVQTGDEGRG